jgi:putative PIN family toxin of toxin-antitoxin system
MMELADVMARCRFDRYLSRENRERFVLELCSIVEFVPIIQTVRECQDPDNDKILEVALNGRADVIISGDEDLLALNPWRGMAILRAAQYLSQQSDQEI